MPVLMSRMYMLSCREKGMRGQRSATYPPRKSKIVWLSKQNEVKMAGSRKSGHQVRAAVTRTMQTGNRVISE